MSSIDKLAQKRRWRDSIKQKFNIGDAALGWLDPTYSKFRKDLFAADKLARKDAMRLKEFKTNAENAFKQKNYLYAAAQIGYYYDLVGKISEDLRKVFSRFDADEMRLLVDHLDPETQQYIKSRLSKKSGREDQIIKVAVLDWLRNFLSTRRRAISILEKNFGAKNIQRLRDGLAIALKKLNVLHVGLLKAFDGMSAALGSADYEQYRIELTKLFITADVHRKEYDEFFMTSVQPYHEYITKQIERLEQMQNDKRETERNVAELAEADAKQQQLNESEPEARADFDKKLEQTPGASQLSNLPTGMLANQVWQKAKPVSPPDEGPLAIVPPPAPAAQPASGPKGQLPLPGFNMNPTHLDMPASPAPAGPTPPAPSTQMSLLDYKAPTLPATPKPENKGRRTKKTTQPGAADDTYYHAANDHSEFLVSLASCDTRAEMLNTLLSYSEHLEDANPEESLKILAIAEGLMDVK